MALALSSMDCEPLKIAPLAALSILVNASPAAILD
jgi:hypothetical protein